MQSANTNTAAFAFMAMMAALLLISYNGRAVALPATNGAEAQMMAPGFAPMPAPQMPVPSAPPAAASAQYGLIQTSVVAVGPVDGMGRRSVMPVFQVIELQSMTSASAIASVEPAPRTGLETSSATPGAPQLQGQPMPNGITMAPPAQAMGQACDVNGIRVITPSAAACATAGGHLPPL